MLHEPVEDEDVVDLAEDYKSALGVKLFIVYALVYAGFVAIGLVAIEKYEVILFWGLNVAVVYGFGLIVFALVLALIYDKLCSAREAAMNSEAQQNTDAPSNQEGGAN